MSVQLSTKMFNSDQTSQGNVNAIIEKGVHLSSFLDGTGDYSNNSAGNAVHRVLVVAAALFERSTRLVGSKSVGKYTLSPCTTHARIHYF